MQLFKTAHKNLFISAILFRLSNNGTVTNLQSINTLFINVKKCSKPRQSADPVRSNTLYGMQFDII